jgi:hypothetical protein
MGVDPREFAHDLGVQLDQLVASVPSRLLPIVAHHCLHGTTGDADLTAYRLKGVAALEYVANHVCPVHAKRLHHAPENIKRKKIKKLFKNHLTHR